MRARMCAAAESGTGMASMAKPTATALREHWSAGGNY
jgi:hypothetical protein